MEQQGTGKYGLCICFWYRSTHGYLEFRINLFGGCAPYVSQDPRLGYLVLGFSADRESRIIAFFQWTINSGPPTFSIRPIIPSPGPAQHNITQLALSMVHPTKMGTPHPHCSIRGW